MKNYRELEIFKVSKELAIEVHKMSLTLPKFEQFEQASQIRRSSKSVAANIVEGYGRRRYKADFVKHLIYSVSECDETLLHLDFLQQTGSLTEHLLAEDLRVRYTKLSKQINKFIQWVDGQPPATSHQPPATSH